MGERNSFNSTEHKSRKNGGALRCNAPHIYRLISDARENKSFYLSRWYEQKKKKYMNVPLIHRGKKNNKSVAYTSILLDKNLC